MSHETTTLDRAVEEVKQAAEFLKSEYMEARILEQVHTSVVQAQSPWVDRADAAAYWRCSTSEIDRASGLGILKRHDRGGTPMFDKAQGDAALREGKWKIERKSAKGAEKVKKAA